MKYWHRATHVWVVNDKNKILCQQRSLGKDVNPGKWQSFFGGHLKAGQSYIDSAVEELREELGIQIDPNQLRALHILRSEPAKHFGQIYLLRWNGAIGKLNCDRKEIDDIRWMSVEEVESHIDKGLFCNRMDPVVKKLLA